MTLNSPLSQELFLSYDKLKKLLNIIPSDIFFEKRLPWTNEKVSIADIIAYQIGCGSFVITCYENGIKNKQFIMPGDGFSKWDYKAIAHHFYQKYSKSSQTQLINKFSVTVETIIHITEQEYHSGNLDKTWVWAWCKLKSGKEWALGKWIRVNAVAPYKKAYTLINKSITKL